MYVLFDIKPLPNSQTVILNITKNSWVDVNGNYIRSFLCSM